MTLSLITSIFFFDILGVIGSELVNVRISVLTLLFSGKFHVHIDDLNIVGRGRDQKVHFPSLGGIFRMSVAFLILSLKLFGIVIVNLLGPNFIKVCPFIIIFNFHIK
jgi:hypothetical protein